MNPSGQPNTKDVQGGYHGENPPYNYGPPPAIFTSQPTTSTVMTNVIMVPQPQYKDYLGCSIATMIFCCLPIGIAATIFSCKTQESTRRGDMTAAASDSRMAFTLNMVALGLGIAGHLIWILYVIITLALFGVAVQTHYYNG